MRIKCNNWSRTDPTGGEGKKNPVRNIIWLTDKTGIWTVKKLSLMLNSLTMTAVLSAMVLQNRIPTKLTLKRRGKNIACVLKLVWMSLCVEKKTSSDKTNGIKC